MQTPRTHRPITDERGGVAKLLITLLVLIVVAGGAAYWFLIREDTKPKPKITQTPVAVGTGTADGTWTLTANDSDGSFAQYRIGEQFAGGVIHSEATGHTNDVKGTMKVSGTTVSGVNITANLAALKSDKDFRDGVIKDRGLETNKFPTATFVSTAPATLPGAPVKGATVDVPITGDLTLHGVTKPVTITLKGRWDGAKIQVVGDLAIKLPDYGMTAPTSQIVAAVDDHGSLELKLFFTKAS